jgi:hypothetical protein
MVKAEEPWAQLATRILFFLAKQGDAVDSMDSPQSQGLRRDSGVDKCGRFVPSGTA